jgi:hypothetical protein
LVDAALTLDEFGKWLNLLDVYRARVGRANIDAVILFGGAAGRRGLGRAAFRKHPKEATRIEDVAIMREETPSRA